VEVLRVRILVSAASKHGSTMEIAEQIAESMQASIGSDVVIDALPASEADDVTSYDAAVVGSAVYMGRWMDDARRLAARFATQPSRPVWLFSSGPVGVPPKPDEEPVDGTELATMTSARDHRVFAGRIDRHRLTFAERVVVRGLRVPDGDFRDWQEIDAWAAQIAGELRTRAQVP
jgi:menaquinone-dependent protoporphyrinogen oxidase